jgi:predicted RNA-binding protein with PUA-like domain
MPLDYLLKTEPSAYSFADLQRDKLTTWDGVTNPTAVKHLREMQAGAPDVDFRACKTKGDRTLMLANMKGEKTVSNGKVELAKDGKSRTLETTNFGANGKKIHAKYVYDKQ